MTQTTSGDSADEERPTEHRRPFPPSLATVAASLVIVQALIAALWPSYDPLLLHRAVFALLIGAVSVAAVITIGRQNFIMDREATRDRARSIEMAKNIRRSVENSQALMTDIAALQRTPANSAPARAYKLAAEIRKFIDERYAERGGWTSRVQWNDPIRPGLTKPSPNAIWPCAMAFKNCSLNRMMLSSVAI